MAEDIIVPENVGKREVYQSLLPQVQALIRGEENIVANMANITAALSQAFGFFWVGFYVVDKDQLVLGPFQGPIACTRINIGKGVCGESWAQKKTLIVPNVDEFPGHIVCSADSKSEIVIPGIFDNEVKFVLDVDSDQLNQFSKEDEKGLSSIVDALVVENYGK